MRLTSDFYNQGDRTITKQYIFISNRTEVKQKNYECLGFRNLFSVIGHQTTTLKTQSFLILLLLPLLFGCDSFYPKANFHLINFSKDKPVTDISVKFAGDVIYTGPLIRSKFAPDIQYMFNKSASKGKYNIIIEADSGRIKETHPLSLGKDKWILIGYNYQKSVDSATLIRSMGFVDSSSLKGIFPKITVDVRNEPIKEYY